MAALRILHVFQLRILYSVPWGLMRRGRLLKFCWERRWPPRPSDRCWPRLTTADRLEPSSAAVTVFSNFLVLSADDLRENFCCYLIKIFFTTRKGRANVSRRLKTWFLLWISMWVGGGILSHVLVSLHIDKKKIFFISNYAHTVRVKTYQNSCRVSNSSSYFTMHIRMEGGVGSPSLQKPSFW